MIPTKNDVRYEVYVRDKFKCTSCGCDVSPLSKKGTDNLATVHAIKPIIHGGWYCEQNLRTMCYKCNPYKGGWIHYLNWLKTISFVPRPSTAKEKRAVARSYRAELIARDGANCYICDCPLTPPMPPDKQIRTSMTVDHVVPISKGGTSTLDNLKLCCYGCNRSKGSKQYRKKKKVKWTVNKRECSFEGGEHYSYE